MEFYIASQCDTIIKLVDRWNLCEKPKLSSYVGSMTAPHCVAIEKLVAALVPDKKLTIFDQEKKVSNWPKQSILSSGTSIATWWWWLPIEIETFRHNIVIKLSYYLGYPGSKIPLQCNTIKTDIAPLNRPLSGTRIHTAFFIPNIYFFTDGWYFDTSIHLSVALFEKNRWFKLVENKNRTRDGKQTLNIFFLKRRLLLMQMMLITLLYKCFETAAAADSSV